MAKLSEFTEDQLRNDKFKCAVLQSNYYVKWAGQWLVFEDNGEAIGEFTVGPKMMSITSWEIYKPELKLEAGKFYKNRTGAIYECLKTGIVSTFGQSCAAINVNTGNIKRFDVDGRWTPNAITEYDLIEEVSAPC